MASTHIGSSKIKQYVGNVKVKKAYIGNVKVYSSGNIVTYNITTDESYQEEVDSDSSCLSPASFTPALDGYTFVGWRTDSQANGSVLTSKIMGDDPITLYAVFERTVTITLYNNSTTATTRSGIYYYNNGNTSSPIFTVSSADRDGWNFIGWSTSDQANNSVVYQTLDKQEISNSCTLYAVYNKDITIHFYNNGSNSVEMKTAFYNSSGNESYPTFTQKANTKDDWLLRGWSTSDEADGDVSYNNINNTEFTSSTSLYTVYYRTVYLYYGIDKDNYKEEEDNLHTEGTCYYNSSGNLQTADFTVLGNSFKNGNNKFLHWSSVDGSVTYDPDDTISMDGSSLVYTIVGVWDYVQPYTFFKDGKFYDKNDNEITVQRWMHYGALDLYQYRCEETGAVVSGDVLDARTEPHARMDYPNGGGNYQFKYGNNIFITATRTMGNYAMAHVKFYNVDAAGCSKVKFTLDYHHSGDIDFMDKKWEGGVTVDRDYSWPVRFSLSDGTYQGADLGITKIEFLT